MKTIFLSLFLLSACSFQDFEKEIQSRPNLNKANNHSHEKRVIIAGLHSFDMHTNMSSERYKNSEYNSSKAIESGGLDLLQAYLTILESMYPNQILNLSFGSSIKNVKNIKRKKDVLEKGFSNLSSFTENDLLLYQSNPEIISQLKIPHINSNIIDLKTNAPLKSKNIKPFHIQEINGVKIGILSVSSFKPSKEYIKQTQGLYFEDPVLSVLKNTKYLKSKGAQVSVLLLNTSNNSEEAISLIKRLPFKGVDLIFTDALIGKNFIENGIQVYSDNGQGKYLNYTEIIFDTKAKKIINNKAKILQPVKLCRQFFTVTDDCYTANDSRGKLRNKVVSKDLTKTKDAKFLGVKIIN